MATRESPEVLEVTNGPGPWAFAKGVVDGEPVTFEVMCGKTKISVQGTIVGTKVDTIAGKTWFIDLGVNSNGCAATGDTDWHGEEAKKIVEATKHYPFRVYYALISRTGHVVE